MQVGGLTQHEGASDASRGAVQFRSLEHPWIGSQP